MASPSMELVGQVGPGCSLDDSHAGVCYTQVPSKG